MTRREETERIEELCEEIWSLAERGESSRQRVTRGSKLPDAASVLEELLDQKLAREAAGRIFLTENGQAIARAIVRRHRLAEVLLGQVMAIEDSATESAACEMEHILSAHVADSICTYLGHPPHCPHGKPIPRGPCCRILAQELRPLVARMVDLSAGETGQIVFIAASSRASLDRISSLGVVPGARIRLLQRRPSVVFESGHTTVAVDREIGEEIFVRRG